METRLLLRIRGYVQGVSFRYYARQRAAMLGLKGWVRNCPDGSVEAMVQGDEDAVNSFVDWAHRGPSMAQVERVDTERQSVDPSLQAFRIIG